MTTSEEYIIIFFLINFTLLTILAKKSKPDSGAITAGGFFLGFFIAIIIVGIIYFGYSYWNKRRGHYDSM